MTRARTSPGGLAAMLLVAAAAIAQQPETPVPAEGPAVPRNEETARLARETVERLNALYFDFRATGVPGFVARFSVSLDGAPAGTLSVTFSKARDRVAASLDSAASPEIRRRAETAVERAVHIALAPGWTPEGLYAVREPGRIVMDLDAAGAGGDPDTLSHKDFVAEDLLHWRHVFRERDGGTVEEAVRFEVADGKAFVASHSRSEKGPRGDSVVANAFKYCHREGRVFLKRLFVEESAPEPRRWEFELQSVEFREPAIGEGLADDERAGAEVIEAVQGVHYSLYGTTAKSFDAFFAVEWAEYPVGRLHVQCDVTRSEWKIDAEGPVPETVQKDFLSANGTRIEDWLKSSIRDWLWHAVLFGFGAGEDLRARAKRLEDRIVLVYDEKTGTPGQVSVAIVLTLDGVVRSIERHYQDGAVAVSQFDQQVADGKYLRKSLTQRVKEASGEVWQQSVEYTYRRMGRFLFPSVIHTSSSPGDAFTRSADTWFRLETVTFKE